MLYDRGHTSIRLIFAAEPLAVRAALANLVCSLCDCPVTQDTLDRTQLVLAEALNNIVEHAYSRQTGTIELFLTISPHWLRCEIIDFGQPMPGRALPAGDTPHPAGDDLPEGGFGWPLIRALTQNLTYRREGSRNRLAFQINAQQSRI